MLGSEVLQVVDVFVCQYGDVHLHTWQVAVLPLTQSLAVHDSATQLHFTHDFIHPDADGPISQQDHVARLHALAELVIAQPDARLPVLILVALKLCVLGAHSLNDNDLPCLKADGLVVSQHSRADLRALCVQQRSSSASLLLTNLPKKESQAMQALT